MSAPPTRTATFCSPISRVRRGRWRRGRPGSTASSSSSTEQPNPQAWPTPSTHSKLLAETSNSAASGLGATKEDLFSSSYAGDKARAGASAHLVATSPIGHDPQGLAGAISKVVAHSRPEPPCGVAVRFRMAGDHWNKWFWSALHATSGTEVNRAYGFQAAELTDDHAIVRWSPRREVFTHLPDAGDFVYGGAVGAALHCGTMIGAVVVLADDEFPMTLHEDHRFFRPASFGDTYLVTGTPDRRTRSILWTSTTIVAESTGHTVAESTSVNQLVRRANE